MSKLRDHIERLLEDREPNRSDDAVDARLKADFSEALDQPDKGTEGAKPDDLARTAAFLDGRLTGNEREAFLAELAHDPARRADLESATELVGAMDSSAQVPAELAAWAQQLGQAPAPAPSPEPVRVSLWDRLLARRHRPVWAGVTALLLVAVVGSGVLMHDQAPMSPPPPAEDSDARSVGRPQATPPPAAQHTPPRQSAPPPEAAERSAALPPSPDRLSRPELPAPAPPLAQSGTALGGSFRLTDQNGRPVSDQDLRGSPFLVFFGSVNCPDVCATTLSEMSELLRALGPDAGKVNALFVTVDPDRDTPDRLKTYLARFDPRLRGLTGSPAAVEALLRAYQVDSRKRAQGTGYDIAPTSLVYLVDKQGRLVAPFSLKRPAGEAAAALRRYF